MHGNSTRSTPRPFTPAYFLGRPSWMYLDRFSKRGDTRRTKAA
jgi:hypothetical protein